MSQKYEPILQYIESYWDSVLVPADSWFKGTLNPLMQIGRISVPGPFISPNHAHFAGTQFYWDSYFTILGLVTSKRTDLAKSTVDNLCFLQQKFGLIPARNSWTSVGRTQPPYLTRMAYEIYDRGVGNKDWMEDVMMSAHQEYEKVWTQNPRIDTISKLSRYHPRFFPKRLSVYESGWDKSRRFIGQGTDILPVDLNCLLYQYEADFLAWAKICKDDLQQLKWQAALKSRQEHINKYFWNDKDGFFYDYSLSSKQQCTLKTLAGFYPLWCGLATKDQAEKCRLALRFFEAKGGLASTQKLAYNNMQWDYPNGWAPLQWIVIEGLRRYGYVEDADRLTRKWLDCNVTVFNATGSLWEKYDVVESGVGLSGRYATQPGFAWTNSIFLRLHSSLNF